MIDPKYILQLKGRAYPTWPGVLDAATRAGLRSLKTTLLQAPSPENGHMAIVLARALFDDGREFEDLGDASPANCSAQIAAAAIRMASTRAKGRALRDALNVGETMYEELPDEERREAANGAGQPSVPVQPGLDGSVASGVRGGSAASAPARAAARPPAAATNGQSTAGLRCTSPGCERYVTHLQRERSLEAVGDVLCPTCLQTRGAQV